jgi:hypothetical protein
MDYKYIEQLLERYWKCETSLAEEEILRSFFQQDEIPEELLPYKDLFVYEHAAKSEKLSDDFDAKIMAQVKEPVVKARRITFVHRMRPLFKAAAVVAIVLTIGNAAQQSFKPAEDATDYNYDTYSDTYSDPQVAYQHVSTALKTVSEGLSQLQSDSLKNPDSPVKGTMPDAHVPNKTTK